MKAVQPDFDATAACRMVAAPKPAAPWRCSRTLPRVSLTALKSGIRRVLSNCLVLIGAAFCVAAVLQSAWIAPLLNRMPGDGSDEARSSVKIRSRDTPDGPWSEGSVVGRRVDRTLLRSANHVVIEGHLYWSTEDGTPIFHNTGIYGVDRHTRANLPGYGDTERFGQYLFPRHTGRRDYRLWDPVFAGPRAASFERDDSAGGLPVRVFRFTAANLDETAGFVHRPDVPERFEARTDGSGRLWVEPTSGIVIDLEERGSSFLVEPKTGERVAEILTWNARYDDATRAAKLQQAHAARRRILVAEVVLPSVLLLIGIACVVLGAWQLRRRTRPALAPKP